jgi:hypothetical protein
MVSAVTKLLPNLGGTARCRLQNPPLGVEDGIHLPNEQPPRDGRGAQAMAPVEASVDYTAD